MSDTGANGGNTAEVVVYGNPPGGLVPSPGSGDTESSYDDPQYQAPSSPPDIDKFKAVMCYANSRIRYNQQQQGKPNQEYDGMVYRSNDDGTYASSDFFYAGATRGSLDPAITWLQDQGISLAA